jgi:hypothetical protein
LYNEAKVDDGSEKERMMRKLGLVVAVVMLLSVLVASMAAAASMPGGMEASANASGSPATEVVAAGRQGRMITDDSIFAQFGFCDDNGDVSPVSY